MIEGDWSEFVPVRLPVDWEYKGKPGIHPEIEGVTGRDVVLLIEKRFTRFEKFLAKILKVISLPENLRLDFREMGFYFLYPDRYD